MYIILDCAQGSRLPSAHASIVLSYVIMNDDNDCENKILYEPSEVGRDSVSARTANAIDNDDDDHG